MIPKITQGQNTPLVVDYGTDMQTTLSGASAIECSLIQLGISIKHWSKADITISEGTLSLPLTEEETLAFDRGKAKLLVKLLDADEVIQFMKKVPLVIKRWEDTTAMTEE